MDAPLVGGAARRDDKAPAAEPAHPDDGAHFRVLLVALGIAAAAGGPARTTFPVVGYEMGMSTRCIEIV